MSETKSGKSSLIPLLSRHSAQPADSEEGHEAACDSAQLHIAEIATYCLWRAQLHIYIIIA